MKNIVKYCVVLMIMTTFLSISCKKTLTLAPEDSFSSENFWQNEAQAQNYMAGLHVQFRKNMFMFLRLGEFRGGALTTQEIFPVTLNEIPLIEQRIDEINAGVSNWAGFYSNILKLNLFISKVEGNQNIALLNQNYLLGQAYGLRAFYYFHLLRSYGGVPLVTTPEVALGITNPVALRKERATEEAVLAQIKADVEKSATSFGTQNTKDKGFWNPMASKMLKGEVYLWSAKVYNTTADLAPAKAALLAISANTLQANFADVFVYTNKKNAEIIFTISNLMNESEMDAVSSFTYDLPGLGGGYYPDSLGSAPLISTNPDPLYIGQTNSRQIIQRYRYNFNLYQSFNDLDTRKKATFFALYRLDKSTNPARVLARNTVLKKFLGIFEFNKRHFSDDWPIYREADRLLMLAEIANQDGQDPTIYIKAVRDRAFGGAGKDPKPFVNSTKDANEIAIFEERSKEFVFEGKRWYDLRRMKIGSLPMAFKSALNPYGVLTKGTEDYKLLWPIDQGVWTRDPSVKQTPGYTTNKPN